MYSVRIMYQRRRIATCMFHARMFKPWSVLKNEGHLILNYSIKAMDKV